MSETEATVGFEADPNRTQMVPAANLNATQTIQPVQCPVCKTFNPAGEAFCIECGLLFSSALPDDAFGAPALRPPCFVDESGREHFLRPGENLVGREGDLLLQDPRVSRRHSIVWYEDGGVSVEDLGSTNGTRVNGSPIGSGEKALLQPGDKVSFGGVELALSFPGDANATQIPSSNKTQSLETPVEAANAAAFLEVDGQRHPLVEGKNTIGRKPSNDIVLEDPYASGAHAMLEVRSGEFFFTDLGSTNGTFLNGAKMVANEPVKVTIEDEIRVGGLTLVVRSSA